jgi:hypothetical protein
LAKRIEEVQMIYFVGLFFILGLVFWTPAFLAIVDIYVWYFFNHNLTGLEYGETRPLVILLCVVFGVACMFIAANFAPLLKDK